MTIGEQLKRFRTKLGLTQVQMCAGVVSESFYSRAEHNKTKLEIDDLLKILEKNYISLEDFFAPFERKSFEKDNYKKLENKLRQAKQKDNVEALSSDLQRKMKYQLLHLGEWNEKTLEELDLTIDLWNQEEITLLMKNVFDWQNQVDEMSDLILSSLNKVLISYLQREFDDQCQKQVQETIMQIKKLPTRPVVALVKLVARYYQAKLEKDKTVAEQLEETLSAVGYEV